MAFVLCTGRDRVLNEARRFILEQAGHRVIEAMNEKELVAACRQHRFDVAVLGQLIPHQEKRTVFSIVRQHCPSTMVLELYLASDGRALEQADSWLLVPVYVPVQLPGRVTELARQRPPKDTGGS